MTRREWLLTLEVLAFVIGNFWLWSLPIAQLHLFAITLPLGIAQHCAFLWVVMTPSEKGESPVNSKVESPPGAF